MGCKKGRPKRWTIVAAVACAAAVALTLCSCAGMTRQGDTAAFAVETLAMTVGYEMRNTFTWTPAADAYYTMIMSGVVSLDGAKAAEEYLRTVTHPLVANRMVRLAGMVGFDMSAASNIVGVGNVNIALLQTAATGFRSGLLLK